MENYSTLHAHVLSVHPNAHVNFFGDFFLQTDLHCWPFLQKLCLAHFDIPHNTQNTGICAFFAACLVSFADTKRTIETEREKRG